MEGDDTPGRPAASWIATSSAVVSLAVGLTQLYETGPTLGPVFFGLLAVGLAVVALVFAWRTRHLTTAVVALVLLIAGAGATGALVPRPGGAVALTIDPQPLAGRCATFMGAGDPPPGHTLWLSVYTDQPKYHFYPVIAGVGTHRWQSRNVELGTEREVAGEAFEVGIAVAGQVETRTIRGGEFRGGVLPLPNGIQVVDQVTVRRNDDARRCRG